MGGFTNSSVRRGARLLAVVGAMLLCEAAGAATVTWRGTVDGAWNTTTANWAGGASVFTAGDIVTFDDTATGTTGITIATAVAPAGTVTFNNATKNYTLSGPAGMSGTMSLLKLGAGSLTLSNTNVLTGTMTLRSGTTTFSGNSSVTVTNGTTAAETWTMASANGDNATLVIRDNAAFTTNIVKLATAAQGTASVLMSGGTVTTTNNNAGNGLQFRIGESGTASWTQSGGIVSVDNQQVTLGRLSGLGQLNISSGTFQVVGNGGNAFVNVGSAGVGVLTISGNAVFDSGTGSSGRLAIVNLSAATGSGTVNLNGGTLRARQVITGGTQSSTFNFNGGRLVATTSTTGFMQGLTAANVQAGGAVIDSNGFDVSIGQTLLAAGGGLTKLGAGSLTLSGTNTYSGTTTISGGRLVATTLANGGVASSIGAASRAASNIALAGGTLAYSGGSVSIDRGLVLSGSTTTSAIEVSGAATNLSIAGGTDMSGTSFSTWQVLNKTGAGTLTIQGGKPAGGAMVLGANGSTGNTDLGLNVQQGTLALSGSGNDNWYANSRAIGVLAGGTLQVTNGSLTTRIANDPASYNNSFVWVGGTNFNGNTAGSSAPAALSFTSATGTVGSFIVGVNTTGTSSVTLGNSVITSLGPNVRLGRMSGANALMALTGTSQLFVSATGGGRPSFTVGYAGLTNSTLTLADTAQLTTGIVYMSETGTAATALVSLTGTSRLTVDSNSLFMGSNLSRQNGAGSNNRITIANSSTVAFSGTNAGRVFSIGSGTASNASVLVRDSGGLSLATSDLEVAFSPSATGTLTVQDSATVASGRLLMATGSSTVGVVNLDGGSLTTGAIVPGLGSSTINFNGGRLVAATSGTLAGLSAVNLNAGGGQFDTGVNTYTVGQSLGGSGGLTKLGAGTLVLGAANTYSGTTAVNQGVLAFTTDSALPGAATAGRVTVAAGATLAATNGVSDSAIGGLIGSGNLGAGATFAFETSAGNRTYSAGIAGGFGVAKAGGNTLVLSASNAYAGATTLAAGVLEAGDADALGAGGAITFTGGSLRYTAASAGQDWATRFRNSTGAVSLDTNGQNVSLAGGIDATNAGGLTKSGGGTLALGGRSTYGGDTTVTSGTLLLSGTAAVAGSTSGWLYVGRAAGDDAALVIQDSASFSGGLTQIADSAGSRGAVMMTGGTLSGASNASGFFFRIGASGTGSWTQTGGLVTLNNLQPTVGRFAGSRGDMTISSGTFRVTGTADTASMNVGSDGVGVLTISGNAVVDTGTAAASRLAIVNLGTTGAGTVNLDGGTLLARAVTMTGSGASTSTFNFNGGTLVATTSTPAFFESLTAANVRAGGARIDTNGFDVSINQRLLDGGGAGGLAKLGSGALRLTGSNDYTGTTTVSAGSLIADNARAFGTGGMALAAGATLDLNNLAVGNSITNAGGVLANAAAYTGTQTLTGAATFGGLGGTLAVANGGVATLGGAMSGSVSVANGGVAVLGTSGTVAGGLSIAAGGLLSGVGQVGTISGDGLVGPGNSPGILTASSVSPAGGLDFAFEFTQVAPDYGNPTSSGNDVLWLTGGTPFASSLTSANTVSLYLTPAVAESNEVTGGFFTTNAFDFAPSIMGASYQLFVQDAAGTFTYNGLTYKTLAQYDPAKSFSVATVAANGGRVMQLVVVPEPAGILLAGLGGIGAAWCSWRRARRGR